MTTIEQLFAAIENGDAEAVHACLAPGFAFGQRGADVNLDAEGFCAAVAALGSSVDNIALTFGPKRVQAFGTALDVALRANIAAAPAPELADVLGDAASLATTPQTWTIAMAGGSITAINVAPVAGLGLAELLVSVAPSAVAA